MAESSFRDLVREQYRKYRAILIIVNALAASERTRIDQSLANIDRFPRRELRKRKSQMELALRELIRHYGVVGSLSDLEEILQTPKEFNGQIMFISRYDLGKHFQNYERALPSFPRLPLHARVGIDVFGMLDQVGTMETFQLEASLFEDMAILWNATVAATEIANQPNSTKAEVKQSAALVRAT